MPLPPLLRTPLLALVALIVAGLIASAATAEEPFFKKGDVIALVGGEDMVVMGELGYLELLLTRALPDLHLKFRNLAWEGDTVFEQRRDLNFPPLEAQLDQVGATVVICQFGQMESLAGSGRVGVPPAGPGVSPGPSLPEFIAAYEKLIDRMSGGGKRRIVIVTPTPLDQKPTREAPVALWMPIQLQTAAEYQRAALAIATRLHTRFVHTEHGLSQSSFNAKAAGEPGLPLQVQSHTADGIHLVDAAHWQIAMEAAIWVGDRLPYNRFGFEGNPHEQKRLELIRAKNRLWFDYWRVENWAFLAGDRTEQPSSRDHLDRTKRWFPAEREKFLPLIAAKEKEIWELAAKLSEPKVEREDTKTQK